jgi:hypothetical protein
VPTGRRLSTVFRFYNTIIAKMNFFSASLTRNGVIPAGLCAKLPNTVGPHGLQRLAKPGRNHP